MDGGFDLQERMHGQAFSDVTFSVEGRLVHAHRCILATRSLFFRKFFCGPNAADPVRIGPGGGSSARSSSGQVIPVNTVGYEVFLLMLQFLYSGQVSIVPQKHEPRPNCGDRGCWHTHCTSAVDLALDTLTAARSFGVEQLALLTQLIVFCNGGMLKYQHEEAAHICPFYCWVVSEFIILCCRFQI